MRNHWKPWSGLAIVAVLGVCAVTGAGSGLPVETGGPGGWRQHDALRPKAPRVTPVAVQAPGAVPRDAIRLFDGTGLDAWRNEEGGPAGWKVNQSELEVVPGAGAVQTKDVFGDIQLHVEWSSPSPPTGIGQDRGNSGIFLMGAFELQILDSYQADTYTDGQAGAIYGQYPPLANASAPPGEWQTYDVAFRTPRFDASGKVLEPARVTVIHNGILVQNNEPILGPTHWLQTLPYDGVGARGPIRLQDHGHRVKFRNIWLRTLADRAAPSGSRIQDRAKTAILPAEALDKFAGDYISNPKAPDKTIKIRRRDDRLEMILPNDASKAYVFQAIAPQVFVMPDTDARLTFSPGENGRPAHARFAVGGEERILTKK